MSFRLATWTVFLALAGCGPALDAPSDGSTGGADTGADGSGSATTATVPSTTMGIPPLATSTTSDDPSTGSGTPTSGSSGSVVTPDWGGGFDADCSVFEDEAGCPRGEVCRPWAHDGGPFWRATKCVPLVDDPGTVGDRCEVEDIVASGVDSCGPRSMCFEADEDTLEGHCVAYCDGPRENPFCQDPELTCAVGEDEMLAVCLPTCDPLMQDCADGRACVASLGTPNFFCMESGTPYRDVDLLQLAACGVGNVAVPFALVEGCNEDAPCCTAFCDITVAGQCAEGLECSPFVPEGGFFGYEDIGVCLAPT